MHRVWLSQSPHAVRFHKTCETGHKLATYKITKLKHLSLCVRDSVLACIILINRQDVALASEKVKLIFLSQENNFAINDTFSVLFYRYLELGLQWKREN